MSTTKEILTTFSILDDALRREWTAERIVRWSMERLDEGLPADVVRYEFRRLTRSRMHSFVEHATSDAERYDRAFRAGIVRVKGGRYGDGWQPSTTREAGTPVSQDELDEAGISIAESEDVGQRIYWASRLGKGSAASLPPQPSSLAAWDALARPSAERSQG